MEFSKSILVPSNLRQKKTFQRKRTTVLIILAIKVILIKPVCIFHNDFPSPPKSCYSLEGKIIQKEEQLSEKV